MTTPLPEADFAFTSTGTPAAHWMVSRFHLNEGLSTLYEGVLDLAEEGASDLAAMLGLPASFTITRGALTQWFGGIVREAELLGTFPTRRHARVRLVPRLWVLSQRRDSRIFQDLNAIDVVREVLHDAGIYRADDEIDTSQLTLSNYPVREYCAQHDETDLAFVSRLLEDEGVTYFFRHSAAGEVLVLVEDGTPDAFPTPVPTMDALPVRVMGEGGQTHSAESVRHHESSVRVEPTSVSLRDWDFTRPFDPQASSPGRESAMTRTQPASAGDRSVYQYPAGAVFTDYDSGGHFYRDDDLTRRAQVRWTEHTGRRDSSRGRGVVTGFRPGHKVVLLSEDATPLGEMTLTHVEHIGRVAEGDHDPHPPTDLDRYSNTFHAMPVASVFRPPRLTPRPRVAGPQTALVMARQGSSEEVDIDHHGRVLVRFHWERPNLRVSSQRAKNSSCRVRVAQSWAGAGWGVVFNPRVGMEVVVQFLDGNPDRPLITGCVYNLHHPLPPQDEVEAKRTRSTIRTNSSPGGGGFNELYFEDAKGHEQIYLHAQRDLDEDVLHDHSTHVKRNQSNRVDGSQSESIGGDASRYVGGKEDITVKKQRWTEITDYDSLHVKGNQDISIDGPGGAALHVIGKYGVDATDEIDLSVDNKSHIDMKPDSLLVENPTKVTLKSGGSTVTVEPGKITLDDGAGATVTLDGSAIRINAGGNIDIVAGGFVTIKGAIVKLNC